MRVQNRVNATLTQAIHDVLQDSQVGGVDLRVHALKIMHCAATRAIGTIDAHTWP